jgi:hypothetical protein
MPKANSAIVMGFRKSGIKFTGIYRANTAAGQSIRNNPNAIITKPALRVCTAP